MNSIEVVKEYWSRMQTNDFALAAEILSEQFILDWPQSNERIRGKKNFIAVNAEYPAHGRWKFIVNRIVGDDITVVTDVSITDGSLQARAITFSSVKDGKIIKQVEYWPDDYSAPENRSHLVESIDDGPVKSPLHIPCPHHEGHVHTGAAHHHERPG